MSTDPIRLRLAVHRGDSPTVVDAWPVTDAGAQGLDLCVHRAIAGAGWTVSCRRTGLRLGSDHDRDVAVHQVLSDLFGAAAQRDMDAAAYLDQRRRQWLDSMGPELLGGEVHA